MTVPGTVCEGSVAEFVPIASCSEVFRLEIAVNNSLLVGGRQSFGNLNGVFDGLAREQGSPRQPGAQRLAREQFRNQIGSAGVVAHVIDGKNIRMVQ